MIIPAEDTTNESTETSLNRNTDESETDTETIRTEGKIPVKGLEVEVTRERGIPRTSVSSKQRGNLTMREDVKIDKRTKRATLNLATLNLADQTVKLKTKSQQTKRNQALNCLAHF